MSTFEHLADLPLTVDGYALEGLSANVSSGFERLSTVVHLQGAGAEGVGEDVVYDAEDHVALQKAGPVLDLAGSFTLAEFCARIDELDLFPVAPQRGEVSRLYRRWTFQSAALDLALQQAGRPLHEVLAREPAPLRFVVSLRLGEPATMTPLESRLSHYAALRFKLDATNSWTEELITAIAATGAVDSIDFKALYKGTVVDVEPDPALYHRVLAAFPDAWIEGGDKAELTGFAAPTTIRWTERSKNLVTITEGGYDLEDLGNSQTKVTIFNSFAGHGFGKLIVGFALKAAVKDADAFAQRIKAGVEAS